MIGGSLHYQDERHWQKHKHVVKHPAHHAKEIGKRVFCEEWGVENDDQVECAVQNGKDCEQEEPVLDLVGEHRWELLEWLAIERKKKNTYPSNHELENVNLLLFFLHHVLWVV